MKISYLLNESEKITLYTDQRYFGADVPDEYLKRPSTSVPVSKLYGYEPDDKMNDIHSANAVIDLAVAMKSGDSIPPIVVRKTAQGYQVLDGHHRMHAAKKAGLDTLDAVVVDAGDIVYSDEVKTEGKFAKAAGAAALAGACVAGTPGCATMDTKDALKTIQTVGRTAQTVKGMGRAGAEEELIGILKNKLRNIKDGKYDESIYTDLKKKFGPILFKADYDKAAEYLHKELVKVSRGQRELPHGLGYYAQQIAKELQGIDYRTLIDVYKDQYGMEGLTEADKMGAIDVGSSIQNAREEWRTWIQSLPTQLAQEFIDERPNPDQEDIDVFTKLRLTSKTPIRVSTKALLNEPWMKGSISRTPQPVVDAINKRYGTNFKSGTVYDRNPDRFFQYAKMTANTAKPSVMVDGDVIFGVGRMIAALLRGDETVPVWNLKTMATEGGVGIITKQNTTADVKPGETRRQAAKLGIKLDKNNQPPTFKSGKYAKNTSPNKAYNLGLTDSLMAKYKALKESTLEEEDLVEISQTPGAIRDWANSEAANGIIAGFEAEVVLPDVGGLDYDEDREADMSEDIRGRSISDVIEFFEFDEYGMGISNREAKDLRETLEQEHFEWQSDLITGDFDFDEFKNYMEYNDYTDNILEDLKAEFDEEEIAQEIFDKDWDDLTDDEQDDVESSINDRAREKLDDELQNQYDNETGYYHDAFEDYRQDAMNNGRYDEEDFLENNYPFMSDIADNFGINWPYIEGYAQDQGAWEDFGEQMQETLGKKVVVSTYYHGETRGDYYIIEPDSSIDPDSSSDAGAEIVSPPMPLSQAHQQLQDLAQLLKSKGAYTNSSTGLHMGISLPDYGGDIDYIKLVMFTGDQYMLNTFGRAYNTYARSAMEKLTVRMRDAQDKKNRVSDSIDIVAVMNNLRKGLATIASELVKGNIGREKYTSIHIKPDYIEFRIAGGDYLNQIDDAELAMLRFARAYTIAADQDAEREEYLKKLYKLVDSGSPVENLWAQYQSGEIDAEQLKDEWANRVLGIDPEASGQDAFGDRTFSIRKKSTGQVVKDIYARDEQEAQSVFQNYLKQFDGNKETEADYELIDPSKPTKEPTGRKGEVAKRLQGRERIFRFVLRKPQDWEKEKAGMQESIMQAVLREAPESFTFNVPATSLEQARAKLPYYADWITAKTASRAEAKVVSKKDYMASPEPDYTPKDFGFAFTISEYGVDGDVQALLIKAANRATAIDALRDQIRDAIGSHARVTNLRDVKPGDVEKIKKNKAFGDEKTYSMIVKIRCENGDIEYKRLDIKALSADSAKKKAEAALKPNYPRCAVMPYLEGEKTQYKASGEIYFIDDNGNFIDVPRVSGETINIPIEFDLDGPEDKENAYDHARILLQRKYPAKPDDPGKRQYNIATVVVVR